MLDHTVLKEHGVWNGMDTGWAAYSFRALRGIQKRTA